MTFTLPPVSKIDAETAMQIAMNAKAMLLHLGRADELATSIGLDTDIDEGGTLGALVNELHHLCDTFDEWACRMAGEAGVDRDRWAATTYAFVDRRCGVLPDHVRDEDR